MFNQIVLASASPRRKALLEATGLDVVVQPSDLDELRLPEEAPLAMVERLAREKAWTDAAEERVVVGADTAVVQVDKLLGKPLNAGEAKKQLMRLSGEEHQVMTGWCVRKGPTERSGVVVSQVWFRQLTELEIDRYVATGESLDKAGSYGIQGEGGSLVDRIQGSYTNIVGLPLAEVLWEIRQLL